MSGQDSGAELLLLCGTSASWSSQAWICPVIHVLGVTREPEENLLTGQPQMEQLNLLL